MIRKTIGKGRTEMNTRGNQMLFYWITAVSGVVTLIACALWGDLGLAGMLIFFAGLALTLKTNLDERELHGQLDRCEAAEEHPGAGSQFGHVTHRT